MIAFATRAKCRVTQTARIRSWRSQDGRYSVEEINSQIDGLRYYLAVETLPGGGQVVLARKRKRNTAEKALNGIVRRRSR